VLEILAVNLTAFLVIEHFFMVSRVPQNKIPYYKKACKYAKYMVFTIFLLTNDCKTKFA
jgi:hypothetical protein